MGSQKKERPLTDGRVRQHSPVATERARILGEEFAAEGATMADFLALPPSRIDLSRQHPDTVTDNIREVVDAFSRTGLTAPGYLRAAFIMPQLFWQSHATLIRNTNDMIGLFAADGFAPDDTLQAMLRQPGLFAAKAATLDGKISFMTSTFEPERLQRHDLMEAGLNCPPLLNLKRDRLALNLARYLALRQRGLYRANAGIVRRFCGHHRPDALEELSTPATVQSILRKPVLLAISFERIARRHLDGWELFGQKVLEGKDAEINARLQARVQQEEQLAPTVAFAKAQVQVAQQADIFRNWAKDYLASGSNRIATRLPAPPARTSPQPVPVCV